MQKFRLLDLEYPENPYMSLAADETVFHEIMNGRSPPTFRFYRHRNAVILGCFQLAEQEVDMDFVKANNVVIAKRFTGGGAVYHDMGDLNYSLITKDVFGIGLNVTKLFSTMMNGALETFSSLGLKAESGRLNDVTVNGKKILGAAASIKSHTLLFHAAVLVDTNLNTMASVLKVPGEKLKDKGVKTILERVTNIHDLCGKNVDDVKRALLAGYSKTLGIEFEEGGLTSKEEERTKFLYENKYSKPEWNLGREMIVL